MENNQVSQVGLQNFYRLYQTHLNDDGTLYHRLMGTFCIVNSTLHIITDYYGWIRKFIGSGKLDDKIQRRLLSMKRSMHMDLVSEADIEGGYRPDLLPEMPLAQGDEQAENADPDAQVNIDNKSAARPAPQWHLYMVGRDYPDLLESVNGKMIFNGNPLDDRELKAIQEMCRSGRASVRYVKKPQMSNVAKMESAMRSLAKASAAESQLQGNDALGQDDSEYMFDNLLRTDDERHEADGYSAFDDAFEKEFKPLHESGALSSQAFELLRKRAYEDGMAEGIGNKASYFSFLRNLQNTRQRGTHIMIDGNDFKSINDLMSHAHGDQAIRMYGQAFRRAVDNGIGREHVKIHRFGGDEFHLWVREAPGESPEQHNAKVSRLLRDMRSEIEKTMPPAEFSQLNSSHKLSFSAGVGKSPAAADAALNDMAKARKKAENKPKGQAGFHFHSVVKGMEGPIHPSEPVPPPVPAPQPASLVGASPQGTSGQP